MASSQHHEIFKDMAGRARARAFKQIALSTRYISTQAAGSKTIAPQESSGDSAIGYVDAALIETAKVAPPPSKQPSEEFKRQFEVMMQRLSFSYSLRSMRSFHSGYYIEWLDSRYGSFEVKNADTEPSWRRLVYVDMLTEMNNWDGETEDDNKIMKEYTARWSPLTDLVSRYHMESPINVRRKRQKWLPLIEYEAAEEAKLMEKYITDELVLLLQDNAAYNDPLKYTPLAPGQLRLLMVSPSNGDDELRLALIVVSLSALPDYEAVSYVWGSEETPRRVKCGLFAAAGEEKSVAHYGFVSLTDNLYRALRDLRYEDRPRLLWVDSVCIFQKHSTEKTQQISVMYSIYRLAFRVVVWLGPETTTTRHAFEFINAYQFVKPSNVFGRYTFRQLYQRYAKMGDNPYAVHDPEIFPAMLSLLNRAWFTRAWIFQEAVANPNTIIQEGEWSTEWEKFGYACAILEYMLEEEGSIRPMPFSPSWEPHHSGEHIIVSTTSDEDGHTLPCAIPHVDVKPSDSLSRVRHIADIRVRMSHTQSLSDGFYSRGNTQWHHPRLKELLPLLRNSRATDKRDKVFSLISLAGTKYDNLPTVDYLHDHRALFARVVRYWMLSETYLDISFLNYAGIGASDAESSWIPDWSVGLYLTPIKGFEPMLSGVYPYRATADTQPTAEIVYPINQGTFGKTPIFRIRGLICETVRKVGTPTLSGDALLEFLQGNIIGNYPTTEGMPGFTAFRQVIEAHCLVRGGRKKFWEWRREVLPPELDPNRLVLSKGNTVDGDWDGLSRHLDHIVTYGVTPLLQADGVYKRALCVSEHGLMGIVPLAAEAGDLICVFFGSDTPFVLRKAGDRFKLVGECYVFGIMNGEAMESIPPDETRLFDLI